jgi:hypothetical protein
LDNDKTVGAFFFADKLHAMTIPDRRDGFERLAGNGVNTVMIESEAYEDDVIADAHEAGLAFWGGISCFLAPGQDLLEQQPVLWPILANGEQRPQLEWYNGVVPTVESHRESRLDEIPRIFGDHDLDGFLLDFVRWPLHWEVELRRGHPPPLDSSFDRHTLESFREAAGLDVPTDDPARASTWIMENAPAQWIDFKCDTITSFVAAARGRLSAATGKPTPLALCIVPLFPEWVGQRVADLCKVADLICPMSYHSVLYRTPNWVAENVGEFTTASDVPVIPILQIDTNGEAVGADLGPRVDNDDVVRIVGDSLAAGADGVSVFTGTELLREGRLDALRLGLG